MMTWLAAWTLLKSGAGSLFAFLRSLNGWQLLCIALALFGIVQTIRVKAEERHSAKVETQLTAAIKARDDYKGQLDAISTKRNEQQQTTSRNIVTVTRTIRDADKQAQKVETPPLPKTDCHGTTPQEVRDADV